MTTGKAPEDSICANQVGLQASLAVLATPILIGNGNEEMEKSLEYTYSEMSCSVITVSSLSPNFMHSRSLCYDVSTIHAVPVGRTDDASC